MGELDTKLGEVSLNDSNTYKATPFGKEMAKHFLFEPGWRNLNHGIFTKSQPPPPPPFPRPQSQPQLPSLRDQGSFGTIPRAIREKQRQYQDASEARPDEFIRYTYPRTLDESREALGKLLNVPTDTVVFVPNATTGINTVLRNLAWNEDGKDEVLYFSTIYGACGLTVCTSQNLSVILTLLSIDSSEFNIKTNSYSCYRSDMFQRLVAAWSNPDRLLSNIPSRMMNSLDYSRRQLRLQRPKANVLELLYSM